MSPAPSDPHAALDRFVDGELPPEEAEAFRQHLAGCERCQAALHARVQLEGMAQDTLAGESPGATVIRPARWRARAAAAVGVALAAGLALVVAGRLPGGEPDPSLWLADRPARPLEARLSTPAADRHRRYDVVRGPEATPAPPLPALAKLEAKERWVAIADAFLARGAPEAARPYLDRAGNAPEALASRAAMDLMLGQPVEALHHGNQALAAKPGLRPAAWNLALALRALGLPLAAAQQLDAVAAAGEPGWSAEAKELAAQLRADVQRRQARWSQAQDACRKAAAAKAPFPTDLPGVPLGWLRACFDEALARAGSPEALKALRPAAEALDARLGGDGARAAVQRALAQPPQGREALSRDFAAQGADFAALADRAKQAGQRDLELLALLRAPIDQVSPERVQQAAAATADPWYAARAENLIARGMLRSGDRAGAQALMAGRVRACEAAGRFELDCLGAQRTLMALFELPRQGREAVAAGTRALERARREGDDGAEVELLSAVAKAAEGADPDLSAACFSEHTLRTAVTP